MLLKYKASKHLEECKDSNIVDIHTQTQLYQKNADCKRVQLRKFVMKSEQDCTDLADETRHNSYTRDVTCDLKIEGEARPVMHHQHVLDLSTQTELDDKLRPGGKQEMTSNPQSPLSQKDRVPEKPQQCGPIKSDKNMVSSSILDPKIEVEQFLYRFSRLRVGGAITRKDISVKELRHIIPLLIMDIYGFKDEPAQKKVKGLWERAPPQWPSSVPYMDPNNGLRGSQGKPKKDILIEMFHFLLMEYQRLRPNDANFVRFCNSPEALSENSVRPLPSCQPEPKSPHNFTRAPNSPQEAIYPKQVQATSSWHTIVAQPTACSSTPMYQNSVSGQNIQSYRAPTINNRSPLRDCSSSAYTSMANCSKSMPYSCNSNSSSYTQQHHHAPQISPSARLNPSGQGYNQSYSNSSCSQNNHSRRDWYDSQQQSTTTRHYPSDTMADRATMVQYSQASNITPRRNVAPMMERSYSYQEPLYSKQVTSPPSRSCPPPLLPIEEDEGAPPSNCYPPTPPSSAPSPDCQTFTAAVHTPESPRKAALPPSPQPPPQPKQQQQQQQQQPKVPYIKQEVIEPQRKMATPEPAEQNYASRSRKRPHDFKEEENISLKKPAVEETLEGWNPHEECQRRVKAKLRWIVDHGYVDEGERGLLTIVKDLLYKLGILTDGRTEQYWLEKMHEFEGTLDILKSQKTLPPSHKDKWDQFQEQWYVTIVSLYNKCRISDTTDKIVDPREVQLVQISEPNDFRSESSASLEHLSRSSKEQLRSSNSVNG